ncbi:acyltransferase, partial [Actimicrobium sp. CCI2.3]|uniref:acyltransferase family protein n=1 Tax=Actimicrobium sp. CCI2.3 TaxID=3048616 RepID=UPI002B24A33C
FFENKICWRRNQPFSFLGSALFSGSLGVEFFLMISGYVIFYSSRNKSAKDFAVARALRLLPSYWFAIVLTTCFSYILGGERMGVGLGQFFANSTIFAPTLGFEYIDGVYWTLKLEVLFYSLILVFLIFGKGEKLSLFFLLWPILFSLSSYFGKLSIPFSGGYFCYFGAGALLAMLKDRPTPWVILSLLVCMVNCIFFSTGVGIKVAIGYEFSRVIIGTVILLFFIFFVVISITKAGEYSITQAKFLGGLTYPVYLIHAHIGYMLLGKFATEQNKVLVTFSILLLVLLMATFMHLIIEKKLAFFWRGLFESTVGKIIGFFESFIYKKILLKKQT